MNIMQSPNTGVGGKDHGGRRKLYRCGWCGHPTNADGIPLPVFDPDMDLSEAEHVNGERCRGSVEHEEWQQRVWQMIDDIM